VLMEAELASGEFRARLKEMGACARDFRDFNDYGKIPPLRKKDIIQWQQEHGIGWFLNCKPGELSRIYQSPGPIYDPEGRDGDYWAWAEGFFAAGFRPGDLAQVIRLAEEAVRADLGKSVLLVEDNPVNRMVARGYLDRLGCRVEEAEDGARALELASAKKFDVVLLDIDLPDMSGDEVARRLTATLDPLPRLVALTAHHLQDSPEERARLGVERVLTKPISPRLLHEVLEGGEQAPGDPQTRAGLAEDIDDLGTEETTAILIEFLAQVDHTLPQLEAAADRADHEATRKLAHRLKGAAANFHLTGFCEVLAEIETQARAGADLSGVSMALRNAAPPALERLRKAASALGLTLPG